MEFNYQLLARFLDRECSAEEREMVDMWAHEKPENAEKLEQYRRIWRSSSQKKNRMSGLFDAEKQWNELQFRLKEEGELSETRIGSHKSSYRIPSIHSTAQKIARVAAIFLVAGIVGILIYQNWYVPQPQANEPSLREVSTANAQRANLTLVDGSKVMLNAASVVKFPNKFKGDAREVYLEGEAYFDVVSNPEKPFVVYSRGTSVRVLGTSFSVRSYPEDNQVRVVVSEGSVQFGPEGNPAIAKKNLNASDLGQYDLEDGSLETRKIDDMQLYLSWREGYLKFSDEPMENVARELERRFGITVSFENPDIKEKSLTALLKSRSIRNVLDVIAMSLEIDYKLEEDHVHFHHKK